MRDEIRARSALMLRLDSSAKAVTQQMHAISGLLGIALAASQRGIERLDQDGLGCLGAPAAPLLPRPSEGDKPRQVERSPAPGPRSFFSLYSRVLFSWLVLNPARAEGLDFHLTIAVPLKSSGSSAVECLA